MDDISRPMKWWSTGHISTFSRQRDQLLFDFDIHVPGRAQCLEDVPLLIEVLRSGQIGGSA